MLNGNFDRVGVYLALSFAQLALLATLALLSREGKIKSLSVAQSSSQGQFLDLLWVFLFTNAISLILSLGEFYLIGPLPVRNPGLSIVFFRLMVRNAPTLLLSGGSYLFIFRKRGINIRNLLVQGNLSWRKKIQFGFCVGAFLMGMKVVTLLVSPERTEYWRLDPFPFMWWSWRAGFPFLTLIDISFAIGLAPLVEEIVHRGYIYPLLRRRMDTALALPIGVLCWVLSHPATSLSGLTGVAVAGVVLTLLYEQTKSASSCIVAHCMINLSWVLMLVSSFLKK